MQLMEANTHILTVDDDPEISIILDRLLTRESYRVTTAKNGNEMRRCLKIDTPQLVILDLMLPGDDGLSLAKEVRYNRNIGIIMLTGKMDIVDKIIGLEMGADDYITKPFDERELLARVRSILRRTPKSQTSLNENSLISFSGWKINLVTHELYAPNGKEVRLTSYEFKLLSTLVQNANQIYSRNQIMNILADKDWSPIDRSIDVLVSKLRTKLNENPRNPSLIKTIRGTGYKLTAQIEVE